MVLSSGDTQSFPWQVALLTVDAGLILHLNLDHAVVGVGGEMVPVVRLEGGGVV